MLNQCAPAEVLTRQEPPHAGWLRTSFLTLTLILCSDLLFLSKTMFKVNIFPFPGSSFDEKGQIAEKKHARYLKTEIISSKCFNHAVENHFLQWPSHTNHSKRLKMKSNCTKLPMMVSQK